MKKILFLLAAIVLLGSCSKDENVESPKMNSGYGGNVNIKVGLTYFGYNNSYPGIYMEVMNPQALGNQILKLGVGYVTDTEFDIEVGDIMFSNTYSAGSGYDPNHLHASDLWFSSTKAYGELFFDPDHAMLYDSFILGEMDFEIFDSNGNYLSGILVPPSATSYPDNPVIGETVSGGYPSRFHFYFDNLTLKNYK